ncbi:MAG: transcriptional regulator [Gammaproteobacteria bacterium]|nr:transcriptional regulator [Gammaproteobacteria bacterium]
MQIAGPFTIKVIDNAGTQSRELQLAFTAAFQALPLAERSRKFADYIQSLQADILATDDPQNQQGMLTIQQICEQLLPHIQDDQLPLDETIVIEMGETSPFDHLLNSAILK